MWQFTDWYDKNKEVLNKSRKQRYKTDPAYREAIITRTAQRRAEARARKAVIPKIGLTVAEVAEIINTTPGTISRWRTLEYFPVSKLRGYQFTQKQCELLGLLSFFFKENKVHSPARSAKIYDLVQVINHNWGT